MSFLLEMTLSGALLIMAIAIIRAWGMHKLPKRAFVILWCIALFQLTIPFSIPSQASIFNLIGTNSNIQPVVQGLAPTTDITNFVFPQIQENLPVVGTMVVDAAVTEANNLRLFDVSPLVLVYLIGVMAAAMFFVLLYDKNRKDFLDALPVSNEYLTSWLEKHQLTRQISICISDKIAAPLTFGVLRPVILLPVDTDWDNESELNYVLTHEFVHIKRFDALKKLVMATALCIHWFNPFVWGMYALFNRDMEISCDEAVINMLGETSKQGYALTLISMVERKNHLPALYNNFSKYAIEERITAIMKMKRRTMIGTVAAFLIVGLTATVFATSRPNESELELQPLEEAMLDIVLPMPTNEVIPVVIYETLMDYALEAEEQESSDNQFQWPLDGGEGITTPFGLMVNPISGREEFHTGIDIAAPTGTPILAAMDGYVTFSGWLEGYGNAVMIYHGGSISTMYAHNSRNTVLVDQFVHQGEHIADVGSTGMSTGPHLHFEIRFHDRPLDPSAFFVAHNRMIIKDGRVTFEEVAQSEPREFPTYVIEHMSRRQPISFTLTHTHFDQRPYINFALAHTYSDEGYPILPPDYLSFEDVAKLMADAIYTEFGFCIDGLTGNMFFAERMFDNSWIGNILCEESTTHSWGNELFHFVIDAETGNVLSLYMNTEETPFLG